MIIIISARVHTMFYSPRAENFSSHGLQGLFWQLIKIRHRSFVGLQRIDCMHIIRTLVHNRHVWYIFQIMSIKRMISGVHIIITNTRLCFVRTLSGIHTLYTSSWIASPSLVYLLGWFISSFGFNLYLE